MRPNRRAFVFMVTAIFLMTGVTGRAYAEKMAFVNVAKVFDEYEKTKEQDKTLTEEGEKKQKEREGKVDEIRRLRDELALLSDKSKEEKQEAIDEKLKGLQDFDNVTRRELGKQRDKLVREILGDIDAVIKDYGGQKGYDMIFNERALLYHNDKLDVTADVLKDLNSRYKSQPGGKK